MLTEQNFSIFGYKDYNQSDFGIHHLVMSMCRVFSYDVGRVFTMTSVFSWQNSLSFCPASFCTPRPNLPVTPGISLLATFTFQFPTMKKTSFLGVGSRNIIFFPLKYWAAIMWS